MLDAVVILESSYRMERNLVIQKGMTMYLEQKVHLAILQQIERVISELYPCGGGCTRTAA